MGAEIYRFVLLVELHSSELLGVYQKRCWKVGTSLMNKTNSYGNLNCRVLAFTNIFLIREKRTCYLCAT